jgi:hypothetical protein
MENEIGGVEHISSLDDYIAEKTERKIMHNTFS